MPSAKPVAIATTAAPELQPGQEGRIISRPAPPANDARMPDLVDKVLALLKKQLPQLAADAKQQESIESIESTLREHFGGVEHYIRKRRAPEQTAQAILAHFNGQNPRTLARELGVGKTTVYRAIKQPGKYH